MNLHNPATDLPAANSLPVPASAEAVGTPAQQAFREAVARVEGLRERLRELRVEQAEARRQHWRQVGPVARALVGARRALFGPLEQALLLGYFSRAEERQITEFILANAHALQNRFGEDAADIVLKYAPSRRPAAEAADATTPAESANPSPDPASTGPPHERAAAQAQARRRTKAQKARAAAEEVARQEHQGLLSNTKTLYRQLARTHHPDLARDPANQPQRTALMQRITAAYEADDLYTLLQLLAESAPTARTDDDVLTRYTQALHQQQLKLRQQLNELQYGENGFSGSSGKKRETKLRQLKRQLRAETDYLAHIHRLMQEPEGLRLVLRELAVEGKSYV